MLFASVLLSSCTTTGEKGATISITEKSGPDTKGTVAVNNDIKSILTAGGLDTADPMAAAADTKKVELAKKSNKSEIDQLVASLQAPGTATALNATDTAAVPAKQQLAAKPIQLASVEAGAEKPPSAATAMLDEGTVTEESYQFPQIGPNLKPGQKINLEPMTPPVVPANVTGQLADPSTFKQAPVKKASRPKPSKPEIVYAQPTVQRF